MDLLIQAFRLWYNPQKGYAKYTQNKPKYQIEQTVTGCDVAYFILIQTEKYSLAEIKILQSPTNENHNSIVENDVSQIQNPLEIPLGNSADEWTEQWEACI